MSHYRVSWNFRAADMVAHGHLGEVQDSTVKSICFTSLGYAESILRARDTSTATLITALQTEARAEKPRISIVRKLAAKINQRPEIMGFGGHVHIFEPLVIDPTDVHDVLESYPVLEEEK